MHPAYRRPSAPGAEGGRGGWAFSDPGPPASLPIPAILQGRRCWGRVEGDGGGTTKVLGVGKPLGYTGGAGAQWSRGRCGGHRGPQGTGQGQGTQRVRRVGRLGGCVGLGGRGQ